MPAGRPTVLTPAVRQKIAEMLWLAFNDQQIALFCGISDRTVRKVRLGELFPDISKAAIAKEFPYRKRVWDGVGNWCGASWFLERKYPAQFAKPEIQLNWGNTYNQNNLSINISSSDAKSIEAEAKPVRDVVEKMYQKYRPTLSNGNGDDVSTHQQ